jgi:hypothetical protein
VEEILTQMDKMVVRVVVVVAPPQVIHKEQVEAVLLDKEVMVAME